MTQRQPKYPEHNEDEVHYFYPPHIPLPVKEGNIVRVKTVPCMGCKKTSTIYMWKADFDDWESGKFVQDVFPWMSPDKRELLVTGTHPDCWDSMFPDDEEGDE